MLQNRERERVGVDKRRPVGQTDEASRIGPNPQWQMPRMADPYINMKKNLRFLP